MAALFIIQTHYCANALPSQTQLMSENDLIVLIEDAVRMIQKDSETLSIWQSVSGQIYALDNDCKAHAVQIGNDTNQQVEQINYDQLVELMANHHPIVTL